MITQKERTNRGRVVDPRPGSSVKRATRGICWSAYSAYLFISGVEEFVQVGGELCDRSLVDLCYALLYAILSYQLINTRYHQNSSSIFAAACYQVSLALPDPNLAQQARSLQLIAGG
jgi:hypothetical protein